jgi:vacuolar-type H+-ATPase subunit E/Vma4
MGSEPGPGALIGAIEERASEERARIIAEAETRAREIRAAAEAECARMTREAMAGLERELAAEQQRLLGEARMKARMEGLAVRRQLLAEAFTRAEEKIARLREGAGATAVKSALAEEARAAVGEPCTLEASPEDDRITATSADGRRSAENGLAARLGRARASMEHLVAARLFGETGGPR